jgi:putative membrane protein
VCGRTACTVRRAGAGTGQPTPPASPRPYLILLGLVVPVLTWFTWGSVERALRRGEPLPASRVALPVAIGIAAVAVLVLIGIVLE